MITSDCPDMGLGMEAAAPDILQRPPQSVCSTSLLPLGTQLTLFSASMWGLHP